MSIKINMLLPLESLAEKPAKEKPVQERKLRAEGTASWVEGRLVLSPKGQEKFNSLFMVGGGCWEWIGLRNRLGYGNFRAKCESGNVGTLAHRISYMIFRGIVPDGLCVLHRCDNPRCINPDHLWIGTRAENNKDKQDKGRAVILRGVDSGMSKVSDEVVRKIRAEYASSGVRNSKPQSGKTNFVTIARKYSITPESVSLIVRRKIWKHVI